MKPHTRKIRLIAQAHQRAKVRRLLKRAGILDQFSAEQIEKSVRG